MHNYILLVFEGAKTEPEIFNNLKKYFLQEKTNTIVHGVYGSNIYSLYHKLKKDDDLEVFQLLKDTNPTLSTINRNQVSEIYFFFDYDGHDTAATDDKLKEMIEVFYEETDNGKLYISYPMIEALKHIKSEINFKNLVVPAKENIGYKKLVSENNDECYKCLKTLSLENWKVLTDNHLRKLSFICTNKYEIPSNLIQQIKIFKYQKEKYIDTTNDIAVLSSIPIFLSDYYGINKIKEILGL